VAWLSYGPVHAIDRIVENGRPWVLPSGAEVFAGTSQIMAANPAVAINEHADMGDASSLYVWTGTFSAATASGADCSMWSDKTSVSNGTQGNSSQIGAGWTQNRIQQCSESANVYCFQQ
jgi:hypothetical protein